MIDQVYANVSEVYEQYISFDEEPTIMLLSGVYVIHFEEPLGKVYSAEHNYGDLQHYVGESRDILQRWNAHLTGNGSKKTQRAKEQGIRFVLAAIFPMPHSSKEDRLQAEKSLTLKEHKNICVVCTQKDFELKQREGLDNKSEEERKKKNRAEKNKKLSSKTSQEWYEWHKKNGTLRPRR